MMHIITDLVGKIFSRNVPPSIPPIYTEKYTPTEAEKRWAKRKVEASKRRAKELSIFVDLHTTNEQ